MRLRHILRTPELLGALEYDLKVYLHENIAGMFIDPRTITYRQVIVWLRYLPEDSALARRGEAGDVKPSATNRLQAMLINQVRIHDWHYMSAHSKDRVAEPDLLEFPDDE